MIPLPSSSRSPARKKPAVEPPPPPLSRWRTGAQAKIYSRRLVTALTAARAAYRAPVRAVAIKAAADSALALTARGQSRWSRAILAAGARRKVAIKAGGKIHRRRIFRPAPLALAMAKEEKVRERLRTLGRLVPGCRKVETPELLEEAADYVAALELQVKAMKALADALSAATVSEREAEIAS